MIRFHTLGEVDLREEGNAAFKAVLSQPKRIALLGYLCLQQPYGLHRRDTLIALFWPESDQEHARNSLRNSIHALRHALGEDAFAARGDEEFGINQERIWCDAREFEDHVRSSRFEDALRLYRGELLPGFYVTGAPDFERWLDQRRSQFKSLAAKAARMAAKARESDNRITDAISSAERAVQLSGSDERVVRGLIELLLRAGDRSRALKVYEDFARQLKEEFGAQPSPETTALIHTSRSLG